MSNLSSGTHVAEPSANKDCRKLLNQFCRFLPKLKLPISADAKLPLTSFSRNSLTNFSAFASKLIWRMSGVVILSDQSLNSFSISSIEGRVFL